MSGRLIETGKRALFISAALFLLFFTACGDDGKKSSPTPTPTPTPSISISAATPSIKAGDSVTLTVVAKDTEIVWPDKSGNTATYNVSGSTATWTPPAVAGTYTFTVKAKADTAKTSSVTVTVVEYAVVDIDIPAEGVVEVIATKTTSAGLSVGSYVDSAEQYHGFLRSADGNVTLVEPAADAKQIYALDVNDAGKVAGSYEDASGEIHGFVRSADGAYQQFDYPASDETWVYAISDDDKLIGYFWDADEARYRGFVKDGAASPAPIDYPDAESTFVIGISSEGAVAGYYEDGGKIHGFVKSGSSYTSIDIEGAIYTEPLSVNAVGKVVGVFKKDAADEWSSFLYDLGTGSFSTVAYPGAVFTYATSIADDGLISGYFMDAENKIHSFVK
ncbi:MAG: DUF3466 family protein [Acidobacteriota bacterium]|jgi:hypothetical protein|nr:DUF3466 family protein [Acidobacteriota bacterium]